MSSRFNIGVVALALFISACGGGSSSTNGSVITTASAGPLVAGASPCIQGGTPTPKTVAQGAIYSSTQEMLTCLSMTTGLPYNWQSVYSVTIPNLKPTDVVHCIAQMEVTDDYGYHIQVNRAIGVGIASGKEIQPLTPVMAEDVAEDVQHHMPVNTAAFDTGRSGTVTYSLFTVAASLDEQNGDMLKIEPGYGGLWCHVMAS